MKATGIVRKVDTLGRIVLPRELRRERGIEVDDPLEVFVNGDDIIIRKYVPGCHLCQNVTDKYVNVAGKRVCKDCAVAVCRALKP